MNALRLLVGCVVAGLMMAALPAIGAPAGDTSRARRPVTSLRAQQSSPDDDLKAPISWLAIGDSFSSGEGADTEQEKCAETKNAYALVAYKELSRRGPNWTASPPEFHACSGAKAQGDADADIPAQLRKVKGKKFDLITFTIIGNDFGFADIATACFLLASTPACQLQEINLHPRAIAVAPILDDLLRRLKAGYLKPGGQIVVLGYPWVFEDPAKWISLIKTSCAGFNAADVGAFRRLASTLNGVIEAAARGNGARYIDVQAGFEGHNLCAEDPGEEWINDWTEVALRRSGRIESLLHPNEKGHQWEGQELARLLAQLEYPEPEEFDDISPLVGEWRYQGEGVDVGSLTVNSDGSAEEWGEGYPAAMVGQASAKGNLRYHIPLCLGGGCDSPETVKRIEVEPGYESLRDEYDRRFYKSWGPLPESPLISEHADDREKCLAGNWPYDKAHVYFDPDALGRSVGAHACITNDTIKGGSDAARNPSGWGRAVELFGNSDDRGVARCHLIAGKQLGASGKDVRNLVTCGQDIANVAGMRHQFEEPTVDEVKRTGRVYYLAHALYRDDDDRHLAPIAIALYRKAVDGKETQLTVFNWVGPTERTSWRYLNVGDADLRK